jgi:hypothetical protein
VSHAAWVEQHGAAAPPALRTRVVDVLNADAVAQALPVAEALLRAGEQLLADVVALREGEAREAALDLLAADACVTWAFEAAADEPGTLAARAEDAMRRIALAAEAK